MTSVVDINPSEDEQAQVMSWLREFNFAENVVFMNSLVSGAERGLFLVSRNAEGEVLGGLQGTILHRWVKIELMAVRLGDRGGGIGRQLVAEVERLGLDSGCNYAYVDTMSYQAPEFYRALGYIECGRLKDWDSNGNDKIFFSKTLTIEPA